MISFNITLGTNGTLNTDLEQTFRSGILVKSELHTCLRSETQSTDGLQSARKLETSILKR